MLSGTVRAASLAAEAAPVTVHVVDSGAVAMALGFAQACFDEALDWAFRALTELVAG